MELLTLLSKCSKSGLLW